MEFLEKHKEFSAWKYGTAPYTIVEEEEQSESDEANAEKCAKAFFAATSLWISRKKATHERLSRTAGSVTSIVGRTSTEWTLGKASSVSSFQKVGSTDEEGGFSETRSDLGSSESCG